MANWFAIATNPRCEQRARMSLQRAGYEVYLPEMRIERRHKRTKRWNTRTLPLIPRCLFVRMPDVEDWFTLRRCDGVYRPMGIEGRPIPIVAPVLRKDEGEAAVYGQNPVERMIEMQSSLAFDDTRAAKIRRKEIGRNKRETITMRFPVGSRVRAKDGPFASFSGMVTNVKARGEVEIMLEVLGRLTPVELPSEWIEAA